MCASLSKETFEYLNALNTYLNKIKNNYIILALLCLISVIRLVIYEYVKVNTNVCLVPTDFCLHLIIIMRTCKDLLFII